MKVLDRVVVLMLVSAATASAQNVGDGGRPGAGPCPGFEATSFNWACDAVEQLRFEPAQKAGRHVAALTAQPFIFSATVRRGAP